MVATAPTPRIAAVDDDPGVLELIRSALEAGGLSCDVFPHGRAFLEGADPSSYDVVLCDLNLPDWSGIDLLREIRERSERPRVAIITGFATVDSAVKAMKEGAADYIVKPFTLDALLALVRRLAGTDRDAEPARAAERKPAGIVGRSRAFLALLEKARRVAPLPATVLLRGETGTGKDVIARYIATHGARADKPFVTLNCATLPESLVESELFGHVKGAFSGATLPRRGMFEEAQGGTLFLDEIGTLPLAAQAKLLRAIDAHEVRRVGDNRSLTVDVRIIAATNLDLEDAVSKQTFREDLFYRVSVVTLHLPPLRERPEDIPLLAEHFLRELASHGSAPGRFSPAALAFLTSYRFPGNVRELKHALEQACAFATGPELGISDLQSLVVRHASNPATGEPSALTPELVQDALEKTGGNRVEAARLLGVSRSSLYRAMSRGAGPAGEPER